MPDQRIADDTVVRVEVQLEARHVRELATWWRTRDAACFPAFEQPPWTDAEAAAFALDWLARHHTLQELELVGEVPLPLGPPPADESEHVARGLVS